MLSTPEEMRTYNFSRGFAQRKAADDATFVSLLSGFATLELKCRAQV